MGAALFQCGNCRRQSSITAGTIFQDTRKPLSMWFRAMWYVTSQKNGGNASELQRLLGLGSYETAWTWLHKLRRAMVQPERDRLTGWVEVDEIFVRGLQDSLANPQTLNKALVVIAAQADGPGIGRIRMRMIESASAASLHPFVTDCIEAGSTIHTYGRHGYASLERKGYRREITKLRGRGKNASELMPRVHRVASLLNRWLPGACDGPVTARNLPYYLDEFTFRFNSMRSNSSAELFFRLMQRAATTSPATYNAIVERVRSITAG